MTFGIGFIAAMVAIKRRNTTTRLKKLQINLKKKGPNQTKLYQYPLKKILSILFIIMLGFFLEWVCLEFQNELQNQLLEQ